MTRLLRVPAYAPAVPVLFVLLGLIQYPLWMGKGGWFGLGSATPVAAQKETNEGLRARNAALEAEVRDWMGAPALSRNVRAASWA